MEELKNSRDKITVALVEMLKHALHSRHFRLQDAGRDSFKTLLKVVFLSVVLRKRPTFKLTRTDICLISRFVLFMQYL